MPAKVNFILPFKPRRPAGGFRIMYEYANRLAMKGYKVHLYFPLKTPFMNYRLPYPARYILSKIERFDTDKWFDFNPAVTMSYIPEVKDKYIADANIVIATWWATATEMGKLSPRKGKKINLIQGYENWEGHEDLLLASYDMPEITNIVVASHLKRIVEQHTTKPVVLIENAIDSQKYHILTDPIERNPSTVIMTYSLQEIKGSAFGLEALKIVKEKVPELQAVFFGVCPTPERLPDWITFHRDPKNLEKLYNDNAIFLSNSLTEGFSLTSAEAMSCGCSLICTDIEGHREYAVNVRNALIVEPRNPQQIADRICYLIQNNEERIRLAMNGNKDIQRFSWDNAAKKMEETIDLLLVQ